MKRLDSFDKINVKARFPKQPELNKKGDNITSLNKEFHQEKKLQTSLSNIDDLSKKDRFREN
jgi:hypothetical protein